MTATIRAEWTKLRTVPSSTWSVLAIVGLTVGLAAFLCAVGSTDAGALGEGDDDIVRNSLIGALFGQIAVVAFASRGFTSEYSTGLIRVTFAAVPRREDVLMAKALTLGSLVFAVSLIGAGRDGDSAVPDGRRAAQSRRRRHRAARCAGNLVAARSPARSDNRRRDGAGVLSSMDREAWAAGGPGRPTDQGTPRQHRPQSLDGDSA